MDVLEREMTEILSTLEMEENWTVSLFIRGELSNYILDEDWEEIEAIFPDSSLVTIQDAGHWVHAEQPEIFIDTVLGFCLR